jgi:hypothetical protein
MFEVGSVLGPTTLHAESIPIPTSTAGGLLVMKIDDLFLLKLLEKFQW